MALMLPQFGCQQIETNNDQVASEFGVILTASATPHAKPTTFTNLIASTALDSYGIFINFYNTAVASASTRQLTDIAIGASTVEQVIINNLMSGNAGTSAGAQNAGNMYFFPIFIPAGTRISGRVQALIASDTVNVWIHLLQRPIRGLPTLSRVTTYGANTATSSGVSHTPGTGAWPTPTQIIASSTNPVKYLQIGTDLITDITGGSARGMLRVTRNAGNEIVATALPWYESTTLESHMYASANFILSHMRFNMPAATRLAVGARLSTAEARGFVLYGAD